MEVLQRLKRLTELRFVTWEMDPMTQLMFIQNELDEDLECPLSEINTLQGFKSFLPEIHHADFEQQKNYLLKHHAPIDLKLPIREKSRWIRVVGEYDPEIKKFTGFIFNITKEVDQDRRYRNHNLELNAFEKGLEQFSIVARTDPKGRITYANEEFCRLSKYNLDELLGQDHRIVNSGHHPKEFFKGMWDAIHSGTSWRGIVKNKAKDGTYYWVDTIVIPIMNTRGVLNEILSFRFDVTLLQKYKEENQRLKQERQKVSA